MKFLVLIVVLGLRRLDASWPAWLLNPHRHQSWLQQAANRLGGEQRVWWLAVFLPALLTALLVCWLAGFWGQLLVMLLGIGLLLWLVGCQSEFRNVDELLVRGRMNDPEGFAALATDEFGVSGSPGERQYQKALAEQILGREQQLFIAIFWLVVLGFGAAFLVVLNRAWLAWAGTDQADSWQARLDTLLSWPARLLLVLSMALAGNFTAVMEAMRGRWQPREQSGEGLLQVANVAMDDQEEQREASLAAAMDHLEALQGLLLRCVAIWLIVSAIWIIVM